MIGSNGCYPACNALQEIQEMNKTLFVEAATSNTQTALPFVKWVGGKRGLIPYIAKHLPNGIESYWEPFVGGGAVYFTLADKIKRAFLCDTNEELILTYHVVKTNVESLICRLSEHASQHDGKPYFNKIRSQDPSDSLEIAARFIYLNKTCYNGLYRVNKSGQFNAPIGSYKNPKICDSERLREASAALSKATIVLGDFARTVKCELGDFVYCDPPYHETYNSYQSNGFSIGDQERLRDAATKWGGAGASVMLSNSDTNEIRHLYSNFHINEVIAPRNVNCKAESRGNVSELLVTNYKSVAF